MNGIDATRMAHVASIYNPGVKFGVIVSSGGEISVKDLSTGKVEDGEYLLYSFEQRRRLSKKSASQYAKDQTETAENEGEYEEMFHAAIMRLPKEVKVEW